MLATFIPNKGHGITYCPTLDAPKAFVTSEVVAKPFGSRSLFSSLDRAPRYIDETIRAFDNCRRDGGKTSALLVVVDDSGHYFVYDSLTQRGGKGQKKEVGVHRFKLFTALMLAMPGLCQDFLSFMASHVDFDEEPHPTKMPMWAITSKAVHKLLPEPIKELYKKVQTLEYF